MRKISGVRISGVFATAPEKIESNLVQTDTETRKLVSNIGVDTRHVAENTLTSDLCYFAAKNLLEGLSLNPQEVDALVYVTQTPDFQIPSTSPILANRLGLRRLLSAFDVNQGCSGYVAGLELGASLISSGFNRVLLLVGDTPTRFLSPDDRSSRLLFGDGASATLLERSESHQELTFASWVNGGGAQDIIIKRYGTSGRYPLQLIGDRENYLYLNGPNVFSFAITEVPKFVNTFLTDIGLSRDEILFGFHQANGMINNMLEKKLKLKKDNILGSIKEFGNTSSASIPLSLTANISKIATTPKVCMVGFGVGLSIHAVVASLVGTFLGYKTYEA